LTQLILSGMPKDQILPRRFNDFFGHSLEFVDLQNPLDLHQQAMIKVVESVNPPLRLVLGADACERTTIETAFEPSSA
jgi:hypothetical protein